MCRHALQERGRRGPQHSVAFESDGGSVIEGRAASATHGGSRASEHSTLSDRRNDVEQHMDTNMASHPGRLLSSDRVLLHLLEHPLREQTFEVGMELTQSGISDATMVQRKHLSRVLNPMIDQGWVNRTERRVSTSKQRRWVYSLTVEGIRYAQEMRDELLRATVMVDGSMVPFGDLVTSQPLLDVAMHIDETGTWSDSIGVQSSTVRPNIARADAEDLIRRVFERAWFDGILTPDEQALVDEVVDFLHIDEGSIRRISETAGRRPDPVRRPRMCIRMCSRPHSTIGPSMMGRIGC